MTCVVVTKQRCLGTGAAREEVEVRAVRPDAACAGVGEGRDAGKKRLASVWLNAQIPCISDRPPIFILNLQNYGS